MSPRVPTHITLHQASRRLEIGFNEEEIFSLPFEYLRVFSPSAEVQGHGPGQSILQIGKESVVVTDLRPVGHYGLCPTFSDGHQTGIYTWDYLYELGVTQPQRWQEYLEALRQQGHLKANEPPLS
ncbi:MAG: DUF971 domain-containing protein [Gammaproteobacteria bacterium]|jgi:DUF971 family protein|nr:DUF971 domain-containing protein [Gammaproteobacteria bacterium]